MVAAKLTKLARLIVMLLFIAAWLFSAQARLVSNQKEGGDVALVAANGLLDGGKKAEVAVADTGRDGMRSVRSDVEDDESGYPGFRVDYWAPRHHPPKHN